MGLQRQAERHVGVSVARKVHWMPESELTGVATKGRLFVAGFDNLFATALGLALARIFPDLSALLVVVAYLAYFLLFEAMLSRTPAKMMFGLDVKTLDGRTIGWFEAGVRTLLRVFEANPLLLGILPGGIVVVWS